MPIITIFNASFCGANHVARGVAEALGCRLLGNEALEAASVRFGAPLDRMIKSMGGAPSVFNSFTHDKEKHIAYIRAGVAQALLEDNIVLNSAAALAAPAGVRHILRVCLTATKDFRAAEAVKSGRAASEKDAVRLIKKSDLEAAQWAADLHKKSPWDKTLFDIKIPMNSATLEQSVALICENARLDVVKATPKSLQAAADNALAAEALVQLARAGHFDMDVTASGGDVTIIINKNVLRLESLAKELKAAVAKVQRVKNVDAKAGPDFYRADIYRRQNFELPQKVLLVDDEAEYVQTLSERLQMRDFGTAVAFNGEEAMSLVASDEPEVMVLDLRMPGIDGMEVLRRLKREHPEVEAIILTGHGTEKDRELAMELGAFAYLEKPVDIDKLAQTMQAAYKKVRERKPPES